MIAPNEFAASLVHHADRKCRYSGCTQPRYVRPNGLLNRFCNTHRLRQNEHQRAFMQRHRRGERRRVSRVRMMPTEDVWTQMELELDELFDFDFQADMAAVNQLCTGFESLLPGSDGRMESPSTLDELTLIPIDSIDELLVYLPAPYT